MQESADSELPLCFLVSLGDNSNQEMIDFVRCSANVKLSNSDLTLLQKPGNSKWFSVVIAREGTKKKQTLFFLNFIF